MKNSFEINTDYFMYVYMFQLEKFLSTKKKELSSVSFQSDEANTDRPLKEFLKKTIENEFQKVIQNGQNLQLESSPENINIPFSMFSDFKVEKIILPEALTDEIKKKLSFEKQSVYTNPDLCFKISNGVDITYRSVELKSTKNDSIPGSSIQQVTPHEWVIFIKHNTYSVDIVTGQYINAINSKMQFPDRSPRPQVAFNELTNWNITHRSFSSNNLQYASDSEKELKFDLINDWQTYLSKRWIDVLFTFQTKNNEPWFNNNLRKFIIEFLNIYDTLDEEKKSKFKTLVKKLIK